MGFTDLFKGDSGKGLAIGVATAILTPVVLPVLAGVARPLVRTAIKTGIIAYEKGRETVAELEEAMEDLIAEAKAELEQDRVVQQSGPAAEGDGAATGADEMRRSG